MKYSHRTLALMLAGIVALGITASGCATPWFGSRPPKPKTDNAVAGSSTDLKQATVNYINEICNLPKERRDSTFRELNEALLPNHATISCGRGGEL